MTLKEIINNFYENKACSGHEQLYQIQNGSKTMCFYPFKCKYQNTETQITLCDEHKYFITDVLDNIQKEYRSKHNKDN